MLVVALVDSVAKPARPAVTATRTVRPAAAGVTVQVELVAPATAASSMYHW